MRKLLLFLICLSIFTASAQVNDSAKYTKNQGYGAGFNRGFVDGAWHIPLSTSTMLPFRPGAIRYNAADSTVEEWTGFGWRKTIKRLGDTSLIVNGDTLSLGGGSPTDTTALSERINGKADQTALDDSSAAIRAAIEESGGTTNLDTTRTDKVVTVASSTGNDAVLPPATSGLAGITTARQVQKWDSAYLNLNTNIIGSIYKAQGWISLDTFVDASSSSSLVSTNIVFGSGSGNFNKRLELKYNTCLNKHSVGAGIKITGSGTGAAIGQNSTNAFFPHSYQAQLNFNNGKVVIWVDGNVVNTSDSSLVFTPGDSVYLYTERDGNMIYAYARNVTTNSKRVTVSGQLGYGYASLPNTGRFAIYNIGGSFTVYQFVVESKETVGAELDIEGDSKSAGYNASYIQYSFPYLLARNYQVTIGAGPADVTQSLVDRAYEIWAKKKPRQVAVCIGVNDVSFGISNTTWQANIHKFYDTLTAHGIRVIFINSLYDNTSATTVKGFFDTAFTADKVIDVYTAGKQPGTVDADNVHPTDLGHYIAFSTIFTSGKLWYGSTSAPRDSLFHTQRVVNGLFTGNATAAAAFNAGDITVPFNSGLRAWSNSTDRWGLVCPFTNDGKIYLKNNYYSGTAGDPALMVEIPNNATGTGRAGLTLTNVGRLDVLSGLRLGNPSIPDSAYEGDIVIPHLKKIIASTGGSNRYGYFMPFSDQGVMKFYNSYKAAEEGHNIFEFDGPDGITGTRKNRLKIHQDGWVGIGDTVAATKRISYNSNIHSTFTPFSVTDLSYNDSAYAQKAAVDSAKDNLRAEIAAIASPSIGYIHIVNDADYTVADTVSAVVFHNTLTATRTCTIPAASAFPQREISIFVKILGGNQLAIVSSSAIYMEGTFGSTTQTTNVDGYKCVLKSDGSNWYMIH